MALLVPQVQGARAILAQDTSTCSVASLSRVVLPQSGPIFIDGRTLLRRRSWLQFDLAPALPPQVTWSKVVKSTLSVFVHHVYTPGSIQVFAVKDPWLEETMSDSIAPKILPNPDTGGAYASAKVTVASKWVSFDVTDLVRDWVDGTLPNNGLALIAGDSVAFVSLQPKEMMGGSQAVLEIVTEVDVDAGPVGPQGPQGLAGRDGAVGAQGPAGRPGPQGEAGPAGETGPQGPAGPRGADGADGADGAQGSGGLSSLVPFRVPPRGDIAMGMFTQGDKP